MMSHLPSAHANCIPVPPVASLVQSQFASTSSPLSPINPNLPQFASPVDSELLRVLPTEVAEKLLQSKSFRDAVLHGSKSFLDERTTANGEEAPFQPPRGDAPISLPEEFLEEESAGVTGKQQGARNSGKPCIIIPASQIKQQELFLENNALLGFLAGPRPPAGNWFRNHWVLLGIEISRVQCLPNNHFLLFDGAYQVPSLRILLSDCLLQVKDSNFEKLTATRRRLEYLEEGNSCIIHQARATNVLQVSSEQIDEAISWVEELHTEGMELARKVEEAHEFITKVQTAIIQLCEE